LWLDMESDVKFSIEVSLTQWKNLFYFELVGERGALIVEGLGGSYGPERLTIVRRPPQFGAPEVATETFSEPDACWAAQWQEMERAIRCGDEPNGSAADSLACLRIIEAARESSSTRKTISL
jgi:predicted dehydrogenase